MTPESYAASAGIRCTAEPLPMITPDVCTECGGCDAEPDDMFRTGDRDCEMQCPCGHLWPAEVEWS